MEGNIEQENGKGQLPYGWKQYISKTHPDRPFYYNHITRASVWNCPELEPRKKSRKCIDKTHSNSPRKRINVHASQHSDSCTIKKTDLKKRNVEPCPSNSPKKTQKAGKISFKLLPKSRIRPPSPISGCSHDVKIRERKKLTSRKIDVASMKKKVAGGTKTAIVDPIVRDSSTSFNNADKESQKGSVFSRLDPLTLIRNSSFLKSPKKRKSKADVGHYSSGGDPKLVKKQSGNLSFSCSRSSNERNSPATSISTTQQHSSLRNGQSCSSSKDQPIPPFCNKATLHKNVVKFDFAENVRLCETTDDVEMTDISQPTPYLDDDAIEPMKIDVYLESGEKSIFTHIVLDTNLLLSHLNFIDELKDAPFDECGPPVIFIPWIVIQELDKIKQKRNEVILCGKASSAVRYLYGMFHSRHPRFRGQPSKMAVRNQPGYQSDCNDDKILQCCEQLFGLLPKEKVILLTEDKNLISKAVINGIVAYTKESFEEHYAKSPSLKVPAAAALIEKKPETESAMKMFLDNIACDVKSLLKNLLEEVVLSEFQKVYGELWNKILIAKPPWTLSKLLLCIEKHWIAVFCFVYSDSMKEHCEWLYGMLKKSKGYVSEKSDVLNMLASAEVICQEVMKSNKSVARPVLLEVNKLKLVCELQLQKNSSTVAEGKGSIPCSKPTLSPVSSEGNVLSVFEYVWKVIDHFTSLILKWCDDTSTKPQFCSDNVAFCPRFYRCVKELCTCMQCALEDVSNDAHMKELHVCLVNFVPSLKIGISSSYAENFTEENLAAFCRNIEKKELLENGFVQLRNFVLSLDSCIFRNSSLLLGTNDVL